TPKKISRPPRRRYPERPRRYRVGLGERKSYSSASIRSTSACGGVLEAKRSTEAPCSVIRNLVKFHLIALLPSSPGARFLSSTNSGCASAPWTSTFENNGKLTPKLRSQKDAICASSPGSCLPDWLQWKPNTAGPGSRSRCE